MSDSDREAYEKKLQAQLDQWQAEMDKLKAKADAAEADARIEYQKQIDRLEAQRQDALKQMKEFQEAGDSAWKDMKAGMESAWASLHESLEKARSRFRK